MNSISEIAEKEQILLSFFIKMFLPARFWGSMGKFSNSLSGAG
jgi:hypothetical protein